MVRNPPSPAQQGLRPVGARLGRHGAISVVGAPRRSYAMPSADRLGSGPVALLTRLAPPLQQASTFWRRHLADDKTERCPHPYPSF